MENVQMHGRHYLGLLACRRRVGELHAPVHKFRLAPPYGTTLLQFWQTDPATMCIASLPFQSLVFWATPTLASTVYGPNIANSAYYQQNYNELYALAVWLRTAYIGTGRAFYIGNWETDNMNGGIGVTPRRARRRSRTRSAGSVFARRPSTTRLRRPRRVT